MKEGGKRPLSGPVQGAFQVAAGTSGSCGNFEIYKRGAAVILL